MHDHLLTPGTPVEAYALPGRGGSWRDTANRLIDRVPGKKGNGDKAEEHRVGHTGMGEADSQ